MTRRASFDPTMHQKIKVKQAGKDELLSGKKCVTIYGDRYIIMSNIHTICFSPHNASSITKYRPDLLWHPQQTLRPCYNDCYTNDDRSITTTLGNNWAAQQIQCAEHKTWKQGNINMSCSSLFAASVNIARGDWVLLIHQSGLFAVRCWTLSLTCENHTPTNTPPLVPVMDIRTATSIQHQFSSTFIVWKLVYSLSLRLLEFIYCR